MSCSVPYSPIVVAKQSFLAQTAALSSTTIFTPTEDGDYQVSVYITQQDSLGGTQANLTWTDEYSAATAACNSNPGNPGRLTVTLHVPSGNAIDIATLFGGDTYDLFVTVVKV